MDNTDRARLKTTHSFFSEVVRADLHGVKRIALTIEVSQHVVEKDKKAVSEKQIVIWPTHTAGVSNEWCQNFVQALELAQPLGFQTSRASQRSAPSVLIECPGKRSTLACRLNLHDQVMSCVLYGTNIQEGLEPQFGEFDTREVGSDLVRLLLKALSSDSLALATRQVK